MLSVLSAYSIQLMKLRGCINRVCDHVGKVQMEDLSIKWLLDCLHFSSRLHTSISSHLLELVR